MGKKLLSMFFLAIVCVISGCSSVETLNITESQSTFEVASEKESIEELGQYALLSFVTKSNDRVEFSLCEKNSPHDVANAVIDKDCTAAFFVVPGKYCFQNKSQFEVSAGDILHFAVSQQKTNNISVQEYTNYGMKYLTKECNGTNKIIPAHLLIPDLYGSGNRFIWYTGKTLGYIILSPFYAIYGTAFVLSSGAKGAINSGHPAYMLGGALVYALTFWAAPDETPQTVSAGEANISLPPKTNNSSSYQQKNETKVHSSVASTIYNSGNDYSKTTQNDVQNSQILQVTPNIYGPGIGQDQFGRPTQYNVPNWPTNEPTQNLQVTPNIYGPGIGQDQFGRPVSTNVGF